MAPQRPVSGPPDVVEDHGTDAHHARAELGAAKPERIARRPTGHLATHGAEPSEIPEPLRGERAPGGASARRERAGEPAAEPARDRCVQRAAGVVEVARRA